MFKGLLEALLPDGLQQIIDGVHLERAHRVLIVGGSEDDTHIFANQLQNIEPCKFWHLDIEEDQVGLVFAESFDGLKAVGALGENFDFSMSGKKLARDVARKLFIVHNERANFLLWATHLRASPVSAGMDNSTQK